MSSLWDFSLCTLSWYCGAGFAGLYKTQTPGTFRLLTSWKLIVSELCIIHRAISLSSLRLGAVTHVMDGYCITSFPPLELKRKIQFLYNQSCFFQSCCRRSRACYETNVSAESSADAETPVAAEKKKKKNSRRLWKIREALQLIPPEIWQCHYWIYPIKG